MLIFTPDDSESAEPLRRLPYSVAQLVEHSPFSFDDPNRVFVGKKETNIIEVDLDQGTVKSVMGGTSSWHNDGEDDEADDDLPKSRNRRIVQIGRTGASP
jgi:serine/threonine-protein kinase/endoribonuclease IRE1